jgi:argininosuccinate synthase
MERVGNAAFGPSDRIGQLTMRNLDIADSRSRLEQYAASGLIGGPTGELVGELEEGSARSILELDVSGSDDALSREIDASSEGAAFDAGTD